MSVEEPGGTESISAGGWARRARLRAGGHKKAKEHEAARSVHEAVLSHNILSFTVALKHG